MTVESTPFCDLCNAPMVKRNGKFGAFFGCSNYPKCKGIKKIQFVKKEIVKVGLPTNVIGTEEQNAIWQVVKDSDKNVIISALAGTGKTFSIVNALRYIIGQKVVFVAFNKHIVEELETRIPEGMIAKTMNSFGRLQVVRRFPKTKFEQDKLYRIIDSYVNAEDDNADFIKNAVAQLVNLCKVNLIDGKNEDQLDMLASKHTIETNDHTSAIYTLVPQVLNACKVQTATIDFADQLWYIYAHNIPVEQYDVMIADEIQDWNKLQQFVAMQAIISGGRFIGVGDEHQAIYGFSGADTDSIANMIEMLKKTRRNVVVMPLTATRRCPSSHVEIAQQIVPEFRAMDGAIVGIVGTSNKENAIPMMNRGDMGICRRNAPLISIAYALINANMPVIVKGRDIGQGLIVLINKLAGKKLTTVDQLIDKAEEYRAKETEKLQKKGKRAESAIQVLNDKINTLIAIAEGKETVKDMIAQIDTLFSDNDPKNAVILSSVHRSKGLEADRVFVFEYDRIEIAMSNEEFALQERWLHYISLTRSKNELYLIVG